MFMRSKANETQSKDRPTLIHTHTNIHTKKPIPIALLVSHKFQKLSNLESKLFIINQLVGWLIFGIKFPKLYARFLVEDCKWHKISLISKTIHLIRLFLNKSTTVIYNVSLSNVNICNRYV